MTTNNKSMVLIDSIKRIYNLLKSCKRFWQRGGYTQVNTSVLYNGNYLKDRRIIITGGVAA